MWPGMFILEVSNLVERMFSRSVELRYGRCKASYSFVYLNVSITMAPHLACSQCLNSYQ